MTLSIVTLASCFLSAIVVIQSLPFYVRLRLMAVIVVIVLLCTVHEVVGIGLFSGILLVLVSLLEGIDLSDDQMIYTSSLSLKLSWSSP